MEDEEAQMLSLQNLARLKNQCGLEDVGLKRTINFFTILFVIF